MRRWLPLLVLSIAFGLAPVFGQGPVELTLDRAVDLALRNHPRIASAELLAKSAMKQVQQVKSAYAPNVSLSATGAGADHQTAISAGMLQTSALASRAAGGVTLTQLITDFGRTMKLAQAASLRAEAQDGVVRVRRAETVLKVHQAFYAALGAAALREVAAATAESRKVTLRQVRGLSDSKLRSTLDLSFAEVAVSEAELALYEAENRVKEANAMLAASLGMDHQESFQLVDPIDVPNLDADLQDLIAKALASRPELAVAKFNQSAAEHFAEAEHRSRYPSVTASASAGSAPFHHDTISGSYAAIGLNITLPFLNGGLLRSRYAEASLRAQAAGKDAEDLSVDVVSSVQSGWYQANTALRRIELTGRMAEQTARALRLAKSRYEVGLAGILELTQAQLAETSAQIAQASARYEYLIRMANLSYATGSFQ